MKIIQRVTSHCIVTFEKASFDSFKSNQTIAQKLGGLVINHSLRTYKYSFIYSLLLHATK